MLRLAAPVWSLTLSAALASVIVFDRLPTPDFSHQDIHMIWLEGKRLSRGQDPYRRSLESDLRSNQAAYPTYFPGSYLLIAAACKLGWANSFESWLRLWQPACALFYFLIAALLIAHFCALGDWPLACFAAGFWLFNRWTLFDLSIAHLDIPALFFLLLSLRLFKTRRRAALLSLGISLAIKQIAVFVVPFYLVWVFEEQPERGYGAVLRALGWISLIPVAISMPFVIAGPAAFAKSQLLSLTRQGTVDQHGAALNAFLGPDGLTARLPLLLLLALGATLVARGRARPYGAALLAIAVFVDLNPVLYGQYFVWAVPLLPLAIFERGDVRPAAGGALLPFAAAMAAVLVVFGTAKTLSRMLPSAPPAAAQPPTLPALEAALALDPSEDNRRAYLEAVYHRDAGKFWAAAAAPGELPKSGTCFVSPRFYDALMAWRGGDADRADGDLSALAKDWFAPSPGAVSLMRASCAEIGSLCRGHAAGILSFAAPWPRPDRERLRRQLAYARCVTAT